MSFTWTQTVSAGSHIDAADINEVKTNVDSVYTYLSKTRSGCGSGAGWTVFPVSTGGQILATQATEMKAAIDWIDTNKCTTYCASQYTSNNPGADSGVNIGEDSGANPGNNSGANSGLDSGANGGHNTPTDVGAFTNAFNPDYCPPYSGDF